MRTIKLLAIAMSMAFVPTAFAQDTETAIGGDDGAANEVQSEANLDRNPTVPGVADMPNGGLAQQAGTGGNIAYGEAGVLELGGGGNVEFSSAGTYLALRPSIGWFFIDNFEISGIAEVAYAKPDGAPASTALGVYAEPSFHLPFTNRVLGFLGLGFGFQYDSVADAGFAVRPRLGLDILLGRSGILRPAVELTWSTTDVVSRGGGTLIGVSTSFGFGFSYSVML